MYEKKRFLIVFIILLIVSILVYINYDYISFLTFKRSHILNNNKYEFSNSLNNTVFRFQIYPSQIEHNKNEILINKNISSYFDTNLILNKIIKKDTSILLLITLKTRWQYTLGNCLTTGEFHKDANNENKIVESGPNQISTKVVDETGNLLESSATGFGFLNGNEYFVLELNTPDTDFFRKESIVVEFTGLNHLMYKIISN